MSGVKFHRPEFDEVLQCFVSAVSVDAENKAVKFWMERGNCADMTGAIELASNAMPDVKFILTGYTDNTLDTCYFITDDGKWIARDCSGMVDEWLQ